MRFTITIFSLALLAGCSAAFPERPPEIRYVQVPVAVPVGCVRDRPAPVVPLNRQITREEWQARAPGAKAATIERQAGERMNNSDRLQAATGACPDAPAPTIKE